MEEKSLKNKTVKGVGWSAADNLIQYAVSFIVSIVLARLLTPSDYGLIGIVVIFTTICNAIINGGFLNALVRKKDATDDDFNTVFICNFGVSLFLYALLYFTAPLIAHFFGRTELIALVRAASLGIIIGSFSIVQKAKLTKRIDFKSQTKISFISSTLSGIIGIIMAFLEFGVWALVAQHLSLSLFSAVLLWVSNKWFPDIRFSKDSFKDLFGYSWKLLVSGLLDSVWKELSKVVVGKYYQPSELGHYTRAQQFGEIISSNLTNVIQRVSFPVLSEMQDERERMIEAYRKILKVTMLISAVLMIGLGSISVPFIHCLIGEKWHQAALYLPFICITMSTYPLHSLNLNLLQIQGRSDLFLYLEIIKKIIAIVPLVLGAVVGIYSMLIANIFICIISFFLNSYYTGKLFGYTSWMQVKDVSTSYFISFVMGISIYFMQYLSISYFVILPLQIIVGGLITIILCRGLKLEEYFEIREIVISYSKKAWKKN